MENIIIEQLKQAKASCRQMQNIDGKTKERALKRISDALIHHMNFILEANAKDIEKAKDNGISEAMVDRLQLTEQRIEAMAKDILKVIQLDDPIGSVVREIHRPNNLVIKQIRIPIGVIGIIYESRPNVTVDIASLCIKTNNVCVLKGGKEAIHSNKALVKIINEAIAGILPEHCVTLIETVERKDID
ncbi:MAG: gamma-glutamyl-phosphate reductase, partial [Faecalibacillus sp.]